MSGLCRDSYIWNGDLDPLSAKFDGLLSIFVRTKSTAVEDYSHPVEASMHRFETSLPDRQRLQQ
jgi:hypothetical protein